MFKLESMDCAQSTLVERDYLEVLSQELRRAMRDKFDLYDFVVWSHLGGEVRPRYFGKKPPSRRVLIWISDETSSVPRGLTDSYAYTFKAYLPREYPNERLLAFPLGYGAGIPYKAPASVRDRHFSVCFSGCPQPNRLQFGRVLATLASAADPPRGIDVNSILTVLRDRPDASVDLSHAIDRSYIKITPRFRSGLNPHAYGELLHKSKIALCPGGWLSQETFRHYEAMRAGCIVISGPLPETRLYKGSPIICVNSWDHLMPMVNRLLSNSELMEEIQQKTVAWWSTVCCETAQAKYISDLLDGGNLLAT
jgi:hypothetical protein